MGINCITSHSLISGWGVHWLTYIYNRKRMKHLTECINEKHKPRDNKLGVTWCVRCGRLFTNPCGKQLQEADKILIKPNA